MARLRSLIDVARQTRRILELLFPELIGAQNFLIPLRCIQFVLLQEQVVVCCLCSVDRQAKLCRAAIYSLLVGYALKVAHPKTLTNQRVSLHLFHGSARLRFARERSGWVYENLRVFPITLDSSPKQSVILGAVACYLVLGCLVFLPCYSLAGLEVALSAFLCFGTPLRASLLLIQKPCEERLATYGRVFGNGSVLSHDGPVRVAVRD